MTDRKRDNVISLRQYRHQIGEAEAPEPLSIAACLTLLLLVSFGLWAAIWVVMAAVVSAWIAPFQ